MPPGRPVAWLALSAAALSLAALPCRAIRGGEPQKSVVNSIGMKLVRIEAGEFMMGNSHPLQEELAELARTGPPVPASDLKDLYPRHRVRITRPFYVGVWHVTRGQFRRFVADTGYRTESEESGRGAWGYAPKTGRVQQKPEYSWRNTGFEQADEHPVVSVSWKDALAFCGWLSRREGKAYRLPTEAEWEYVCRAGTATRYWPGDDPASLVGVAKEAEGGATPKAGGASAGAPAESPSFTYPVGAFRPNAFGLCDMHGNAWQWCADWYDEKYYERSPLEDPKGPATGKYRVVRGGCWLVKASVSTAAIRIGFAPAESRFLVGFRVVEEVGRGRTNWTNSGDAIPDS
ncbi:MAG: formylglycine-generating enzyme family protein [Thermoguttaceae bacterium]|jgi:formylglycine-generating enzyme required for sulfatase activity